MLVPEYRSIDYVPDAKVVTLPEALMHPAEDIADASTLVPVNELENLWRRAKRLDLPDLAKMAEEHHAREAARIAAEVATVEFGLSGSKRPDEASA